LNTKTIKSNEEFTTQVTKKLNMFNDLQAIYIMHKKHKAIAEERKPKTKTVNYTAKFRIFSKLPDNKDSLIRIG
jgi:histidinol phosphatase-like enzyme